MSSPQKAQQVLGIMETGTVGIEPAPLQTGFIKASGEDVKKAWASIHALKLQVYKFGQPTEMETVMAISERSYKPLDPLEKMSEEDINSLASLSDIAGVRDAQARATAGTVAAHRDIAYFITQWAFVILLIEIVRGRFPPGDFDCPKQPRNIPNVYRKVCPFRRFIHLVFDFAGVIIYYPPIFHPHNIPAAGKRARGVKIIHFPNRFRDGGKIRNG